MIVLRAIVSLILANTVVSLANADNWTRCEQSCGTGAGMHRVLFPFGFSDGCRIRLNCSASGGVRIGKFEVSSVRQDDVIVKIPATCGRLIDSIRPLFGSNYAPTLQNGLILHECPGVLADCVVPELLYRGRFDTPYTSCGNMSCFSRGYRRGVLLLSYVNVSQTGCRRIFSTIATDVDRNWSVYLEFQIVLLTWWLEGPCRCSVHATCSKLSLADGGSGFRCRCKDGLHGDGYADGNGCRRDSVQDSVRGRSYLKRAIVGGTFAAASALAILSLFCMFIQRRSLHSETQRRTRRLLSAIAGGLSIPFFAYKELEKATDCFSNSLLLGSGAYGTVYSGKLQGGDRVAVKKLHHRDADGFKQVMNEVKLLSSVSHPNLVRLLGCCMEAGHPILVYEFMPNGTLSQHLHGERGAGLPWRTRLAIAAETARAIAHLHSAASPPIYHRDIKSSNILLDHDLSSKVADFGLSRLGIVESSHVSTAPQGTPGYLDPQYHHSFQLSDKSDVYSFGVVLVEIMTALKVVDFDRPEHEVNLASLAVDRIAMGKVEEITDPVVGAHGDAWTRSSVREVAELAFKCLAFQGDVRPSMGEVAEELERIRLGGKVPLEGDVGVEEGGFPCVVEGGSTVNGGGECSSAGASSSGQSSIAANGSWHTDVEANIY